MPILIGRSIRGNDKDFFVSHGKSLQSYYTTRFSSILWKTSTLQKSSWTAFLNKKIVSVEILELCKTV